MQSERRDPATVRIRKRSVDSIPKVFRVHKPPPPSISEHADKSRSNPLTVLPNVAKAIVACFKSAAGKLRFHRYFILIASAVFALLDVVAFVFNLDRYHAENSLDFFRVHNWDRTYLALIILVSIDAGINLSRNRISRRAVFPDDTCEPGGNPLRPFDFRTLFNDMLSIFSILILPSAIRFSTALPTATPDVFPLSFLDWTAIVLTAVFFVAAISAIGAICALIVSETRLSGKRLTSTDATAPASLSISGLLFLTLLAIVVSMANLCGVKTGSIPELVLSAISADGMASLLKHFGKVNADISIPSGYYRLATLLKTAIFCSFVYSITTIIAFASKRIASLISLKRKLSTELKSAMFSASIWIAAAIALIGFSPNRFPAGSIAEFDISPAHVTSLAGFGLAILVVWISTNLEFDKRELIVFLTMTVAPAIVLDTEIALIGITPSVGPLALAVSFLCFFSFGMLATMLLGLGIRFVIHDSARQQRFFRAAVSVLLFISIVFGHAGLFGTGSAGEIYFATANPYLLSCAVTESLAKTNSPTLLLPGIFAVVGIYLAALNIHTSNRKAVC